MTTIIMRVVAASGPGFSVGGKLMKRREEVAVVGAPGAGMRLGGSDWPADARQQSPTTPTGSGIN